MIILIWEIIKKITHYYFNKKIPLKQLWIEKNCIETIRRTIFPVDDINSIKYWRLSLQYYHDNCKK